jgi:hypothetical protein
MSFPLKRQPELADFCRWLDDEGLAPNDPFEVVESPDKWAVEYEQFVQWQQQDAMADVFADDRWAA